MYKGTRRGALLGGAAGVALTLAAGAMAQEETQAALRQDSGQARDARMQWWREARFGMFVHWGLYSGLAGT